MTEEQGAKNNENKNDAPVNSPVPPENNSPAPNLKNEMAHAKDPYAHLWEKAAVKKRPSRIWLPALIVVLLLAAGAGIYLSGSLDFLVGNNADLAIDTADQFPESGGSGTATNTPQVGEKLYGFSLVKTAFARFDAALDSTVPSVPAGKPAVSELTNFDAFATAGIAFSEAEKAALGDPGFFLKYNDIVAEQKSGNDDFADTYESFGGSRDEHYRRPEEALFISSDAALHLYHILVDRSFQKIEETKFQPLVKDMTKALFEDSIDNYNKATDPAIRESYKRLAVYYLVPLVVLDAGSDNQAQLKPEDFDTYAGFLAAQEEQSRQASAAALDFSLASNEYDGYSLDDDIYTTAKAELDLIKAAKGTSSSPLFTPLRPYLVNDYSQFKPRSHYTKNNILKSYFIAMMWYGRMGFSLDSAELTRDAIIISGQVNTLSTADGTKIAKLYSDLSSAIEFFVGEVDDLTPYEYTDLIKKQYGESLTSADLADADKLSGFIQAAIAELPQPRIVSEAVALYDDGGERDALLKQLMQFRFMGQRFTPDAYILNNLTQGVGAPDPETGQNLPSMTTALMPVDVISQGNATVEKYIGKWVAANAPDSDRIIAKKLDSLKTEFATYDEATWTQNVYWNWLNSYRSLLGGYGAGYPYFMTTEAWQKKNLGTVLGSYTELKHDTLLYAKQSYAELGAGGDQPEEIPPVPKGYVEADGVFWSRITELAKMTAGGLKIRNLMPEYFGERYDSFIAECEFFNQFSDQELRNETISDEDFEKLRQSGHVFESLTAPLPGEELTDKERRAGIIADIHTDAVTGQILYEATGKPYVIYTAVKDANGDRLTRGLVYNHYELAGPLTERYADEDWQAKVYDGQGALPAADEWSSDLVK